MLGVCFSYCGVVYLVSSVGFSFMGVGILEGCLYIGVWSMGVRALVCGMVVSCVCSDKDVSLRYRRCVICETWAVV